MKACTHNQPCNHGVFSFLFSDSGSPTLISSEKFGDAFAALARESMRLRALSSENGRPAVTMVLALKHQLVAFAIKEYAPVPRNALSRRMLVADARGAIGGDGVIPARVVADVS